MELNWAPEAIVDLYVATITLIASALTYFEPKTKKIKSLFFIRLGILLIAIYFYIDCLTILLVNQILSKISLIFVVFAIIFLVIGVNYVISESFKSVGLIIICILGSIACYSIFLPGTAVIVFESGYFNVNWAGILAIMGDLFQISGVVILFYWGFKTWLNAPFLIKKEALILFLGICLALPASLIVYIFFYLEPIFIVYADIMMGLGILIFIIAIIKEPKLLYILPFTIYRLVVKDREGYPIYDHDWTELNIDEDIFTGFLNAVQLMSEELMNIGGLLDINLEEGILILNESKSITVGLVASKSSKLLRESVLNFTQDFEKKFERELKKSVKDMSQYESAFELIEKYFSNFPYKIIKSKKQPLLLTGRFLKIPLELENKLKKIFTDEEQFQSIKAELIKSPLSFPSEFIKLYDELEDEMKQISDEEIKLLNKNYEKNEEHYN